ncbi:30S ribosome-binding factor RbfA [Marichromatium bheemlicum]|uniref:Ribosome-binding factor A n=1 Tax=Marichromatium bheemlicum TaxID=365339 RepID=A0ABX1I4R0_9GAMM|nr:30S ribosome-binding factor RbfA [Marichromatium bheemlicum]NKN32548.1 30S ribosome-binding factor RbfA [Marichromatium bheemlicum]
MKEFDRTERVGAELQRMLSVLLRDEVKDPRLTSITIQEVRVTRDLAHAKVYFTCFPDDADHAVQERLLNGRLAGYLRHALAQRVRLRTIPQLHFVFDASIERGARLSALIDQAVAETDRDDSQGADVECD